MKTAFVTGASYGMGEAIAKRIARRYDHIILHGRNLDRLRAVAGAIESSTSCKTSVITADLSDMTAVNEMTAKIKATFLSLECLVLNAGMYREGNLEDSDIDQLHADFNVNLFSSWAIVKALLPLIRAGERKRIVIIGSTAAYEPYPAVPEYGVQKWAIRGFAYNLRKQMMADSIGVSFVAPGGTWTGMWEGEPLAADRLLLPSDIAVMIDATLDLSSQAVVEELKVVPMLGDFHD